jgi:hypothetical protein
MRFFKLTHPRYSSDREANSRNPVTSKASHRLPGIVCEICGPWSSSLRIRVPFPSQAERFSGTRFVAPRDWQVGREEWAQQLGVPADKLMPGAEIGPPIGVCSGEIHEDAVHPFPGQIWVKSLVKEAFASIQLDGASFVRVEFVDDCATELWELVVHGHALRPGSTQESLLCDTCGRRGFPSPRNLSVDESRWDGSDFITLDGNPNIVVVTERTASVIRSNEFSNLVVEPIG